jgi:hypothetical protein
MAGRHCVCGGRLDCRLGYLAIRFRMNSGACKAFE